MKLRQAASSAVRLALMLVLFAATLDFTMADQAQRQMLHPVPERPPAPDFELSDIDGQMHRLSDYRGQVVIVNFWATWCPPCREEMPSMQRVWGTLQKEDVVILAVDVGENEDIVFTFTADYPMDFPLLLDRDSSVIQAWPVRGLPTTFVIDTQGRIAYRAVGSRDWESAEILRTLRDLQAE